MPPVHSSAQACSWLRLRLAPVDLEPAYCASVAAAAVAAAPCAPRPGSREVWIAATNLRAGWLAVSVSVGGSGSNAIPTSVLARRGMAVLLQRPSPPQRSSATSSGQKWPESQFSSMNLTTRDRASPPPEGEEALKSLSLPQSIEPPPQRLRPTVTSAAASDAPAANSAATSKTSRLRSARCA